MKKGLLAMFWCTCVLVMDLSNATTTYNVGALQDVVLPGKYGNVSIRTSKGRDVSKDFSCLDCSKGIKITNLGVELFNNEDKLLRVLINGQEVANLSVEPFNKKFNENDIQICKDENGLKRIRQKSNNILNKTNNVLNKNLLNRH